MMDCHHTVCSCSLPPPPSTEIIEFTSPDEIAVCNLASIALNMFVDPDTREFDYNRLREISMVVTRNLNKVIDVNYYPVVEARNSNMRHRPIGIGVQVGAGGWATRLPLIGWRL